MHGPRPSPSVRRPGFLRRKCPRVNGTKLSYQLILSFKVRTPRWLRARSPKLGRTGSRCTTAWCGNALESRRQAHGRGWMPRCLTSLGCVPSPAWHLTDTVRGPAVPPDRRADGDTVDVDLPPAGIHVRDREPGAGPQTRRDVSLLGRERGRKGERERDGARGLDWAAAHARTHCAFLSPRPGLSSLAPD